MAMGSITRTFLRHTAVDFSYPYFVTTIGFITKKPGFKEKLMALLWPYENRVWIALAVALLASNFINYIVSQVYRKKFCPSFNLGNVMLSVCHTILIKGEGYFEYCITLLRHVIQSNPPLKGIQQHPNSLNNRFILILGTSFCLLVALAIIRQIRGSKHCTKSNFYLKYQ